MQVLVSLGVGALMAAFLVGPAGLISSGCSSTEDPTVQFDPPRDIMPALGLQGEVTDSVGIDYVDYEEGGAVIAVFGFTPREPTGGGGFAGLQQEKEEGACEALFFISSDDGGTTWDQVRLDAEGDEINRHPDLVAGPNGIYVGWIDDSEGTGLWNVWVRASDDSGAIFGPAVKVSDSPTAAPDQPLDLEYLADGYIAVSWTARVDDKWVPMFDGSETDPLEFGVDLVLEDDPTIHANGTSPHLAADDAGYLYATWHTGVDDFRVDVSGALSSDGGVSFEAPMLVNDEPAEAFNDGAYRSDSLVDDGVLYVLWNQPQPDICLSCSDLVISASDDVGYFTDPIQISAMTGQILTRQLGYFEAGTLIAAWTFTSSNDQAKQILFATSDDHGATWTDPIVLSGGTDHIDHLDLITGLGFDAALMWPGQIGADGTSALYFTVGTNIVINIQ